MFAYYEIDAMSRQGGPTADNSAEFIEDCRRLLVSELQAHFDPRRRDLVVDRYDALLWMMSLHSPPQFDR